MTACLLWLFLVVPWVVLQFTDTNHLRVQRELVTVESRKFEVLEVLFRIISSSKYREVDIKYIGLTPENDYCHIFVVDQT